MSSFKSFIARDAVLITPHNTNPVAAPNGKVRGLRIGGAGSLTVTTEAGNDITFPAVAAGETIPLIVTHVKTSTTATVIIGYIS
jgi:hypothetical protein